MPLRWQWSANDAANLFSLRSQEIVVFRVRADPEPDDIATVYLSKCPIAESDASGVDILLLIDLFESEAWMSGILTEQLIGFAGSHSDGFRKSGIHIAKAS